MQNRVGPRFGADRVRTYKDMGAVCVCALVDLRLVSKGA